MNAIPVITRSTALKTVEGDNRTSKPLRDTVEGKVGVVVGVVGRWGVGWGGGKTTFPR